MRTGDARVFEYFSTHTLSHDGSSSAVINNDVDDDQHHHRSDGATSCTEYQ
jgi:hypothetical protein